MLDPMISPFPIKGYWTTMSDAPPELPGSRGGASPDPKAALLRARGVLPASSEHGRGSQGFSGGQLKWDYFYGDLMTISDDWIMVQNPGVGWCHFMIFYGTLCQVFFNGDVMIIESSSPVRVAPTHYRWIIAILREKNGSFYAISRIDKYTHFIPVNKIE